MVLQAAADGARVRELEQERAKLQAQLSAAQSAVPILPVSPARPDRTDELEERLRQADAKQAAAQQEVAKAETRPGFRFDLLHRRFQACRASSLP